MSTKALIGIIAAIVVIGGGAWYLSTNGQGPKGQEGKEEVKSEASAGTFAELMARTGSHTCTVTMSLEEAPSTGTVYVSDGKVRGDFKTKPAAMGGVEISSHMIQADGYIYTWTDMMPQGMKMKLPEGEASASTKGPIPTDTRVDYSCSAWVADQGKFAPPSTVTFVDLGAAASPGVPTPN